MLAVLGLEAVLQAEDRVDRDAPGLVARGGVGQEPSAQFRRLDQGHGQLLIAQPFQLAHGQQARGGAGVAHDEGRLALTRSVRVPLQVVGRLDRPAVLVGAQEGGVERVTGEVEVVRVAAEEGRLELRREGDAHVLIAAVLVQGETAAAIEVDHLAVELRVPGTVLLGDACDLGLARLGEGLAFHPHAGHQHAVGDVGDLGQHLGRLARALLLFLARADDEAVLDVVGLRRRQLLQASDHAVVIGQDQSLRRDEAGRAALDAHRGHAHAVQPRLIEVQVVLLVHRPQREVVEGPHALVARRRNAGRGDHHGSGGDHRRERHRKAQGSEFHA